MPAAVVGGIIAGAGALGSAAITSHAAGKAADQQQKSGQETLNLQRDIYNSQVANLAPFRNAGVAGVSALPAFLGLSSQGLGAIGQGAQMVGSIMGSGRPSTVGQVTGPSGPGLTLGAISDPSKNGGFAGQVPGTSTLGSTTSYADNTSQYGPKSSPIPKVKMQAPDGSTQDVPADQVGHYTQLGAKVVQ